MTDPRWVILGCGPSGLIAAHALAIDNEPFVIFSKKRKSPMYGAQLLEMPIPGISEVDPVPVRSTMNGTMAAYAEKVYADGRAVIDRPQDEKKVNEWGELEWTLFGWDIRRAYDRLWEAYREQVVPWVADHRSVTGLQMAWPRARFISTIPAKLLCNGWCTFKETHVWATGTWEGSVNEDNRVHFDTDPDPRRWYRTARIHGAATTEWPDGPVAPRPDAMRVVKPESTDCGCHPDVVRMGRFGLWKTGVLAHESWHQTRSLLMGV